MTETALMAVNRHRLRHLAKRGNQSASTTLWLLDRVEKLLAVVLIANTVLNTLTTALITAIAIAAFGDNQKVLSIATATVAFLLIVFAEISPKVIGAKNRSVTKNERLQDGNPSQCNLLRSRKRPSLCGTVLF